MRTEEDKIYLSSFQIRKRLDLPVSISSLLNVFEVSINDQNGHYNSFFATTNQQLFDITIQLQKAFLKFTKPEKIYHYAYCVQFLKTVKDNRLIEQGQSYKKYLFEKKCMEVRGYQKSSMLSLWEKMVVIVNFEQKCITLINKSEQKFNLKHYFMRQSKDPAKFSLIFQSITPQAQKSSIRIGFDSKNFNEVKIKLKRIMQEIQKQRLFAELQKTASKDPNIANNSKNQFVYLNEQVVDNFKLFLKQVRQRPQINLIKTQLFRSSSKTITFLQGVYFLQQVFLMKKQSLMQSLRASPVKWNSLVKQSMLIQQLQGQKLQAVFYKFLFNDKSYQSIIAIEEKNSQDQGLVLYQTLNNSENKQPFRIDYMILRVIKITDQISRLTIETRIITGDENNQQFAIEYLMEYSNLIQLSLKSDKAISYTKRKSYAGNVQIDMVHPPTAEETIYIDALGGSEDLNDINENFDKNSNLNYNSEPDYVFQSQSRQSKESESTHADTSLKNMIYIPTQLQNMVSPLDFKHPIHPLPKQQPQKLTSHFLDVQWRRGKTGTLININQEVLKEQKKVAKHLLTTFGKNLLKVKGFLNISLPVSVCSKRSHLQLIAYNYGYAPLILQPYCNAQPLERMKRLLVFNLTIAATGIAGGSQKPFNPILGETYQATVNGCNIYLEQISHHPAISAYFFEGRGYKCFGSIQPKIQITGLNSGRGYSEKDQKVLFDDGSLIYLTCPRMFAKGFLFGDREFNFDSKTFIFDTSNLLFVQIHYGPKKTTFFGGTDDPYDLVYGKIYKVTAQFGEYFKSQKNKAFVQKQHIVAELATFEGLWTGVLKINGVEFYNFRKELPTIVEDYIAPLPSNSNFRPDLIKLIEGDISSAQQQKQKGEEIQRRDRNLRQKGKQKRNKNNV